MRYQHDCKKCIPLGEYHEYDLYYCNQIVFGKPWPTLIGRYGNLGEEYQSHPLRRGSWLPVLPWEHVAFSIATHKDLIEVVEGEGKVYVNCKLILDNSIQL